MAGPYRLDPCSNRHAICAPWLKSLHAQEVSSQARIGAGVRRQTVPGGAGQSLPRLGPGSGGAARQELPDAAGSARQDLPPRRSRASRAAQFFADLSRI